MKSCYRTVSDYGASAPWMDRSRDLQMMRQTFYFACYNNCKLLISCMFDVYHILDLSVSVNKHVTVLIKSVFYCVCMLQCTCQSLTPYGI